MDDHREMANVARQGADSAHDLERMLLGVMNRLHTGQDIDPMAAGMIRSCYRNIGDVIDALLTR